MREGPKDRYDAVVIGAGVVGCAVTRLLALEGARVVIVEKEADILEGASKGNSAILHTGFDAPADSLELACIASGYREFLDIRKQLNLPVERTGALVLAWDGDQLAKLESIAGQARANGVVDIEILDAGAVRAIEPGLGDGVHGAVRVPGEYIVDPWSTPLAYLQQAMAHEAEVLRACEVTGGSYDGRDWTLETTRGKLRSRVVINCAGLFGDRVHAALLGEQAFTIKPRKGQFVVYDKAARGLLSSILLPVPGETTKGIVVCPTTFGNVLVGPTAEDQDSRNDASVDRRVLRELVAHGERVVPGLKDVPVTAVYAGIRPATERKEYRIDYRAESGYVLVGGIRSTGLTAAPGIARHVLALLSGTVRADWQPADPIIWPRVPNLGEASRRDWSFPDNGGIVCHCELVTRREVERALKGPLPARSLAGLKRRTRVTMGRCQGFYCAAELSEMTAGRFDVPMDSATPRLPE